MTTFSGNRIQNGLETTSRLALIAVAFALPISVALVNVFVVLAVFASLFAGRWQEKADRLVGHPVVMVIITLFVIYLFSAAWSVASRPDILVGLHKYGKLCFVPLLLPLFSENRWRSRAINGFLVGMAVTLALGFVQYYQLYTIRPEREAFALFHNHIGYGVLLAFSAYLTVSRSSFASVSGVVNGLLFLIISAVLFFYSAGRTGYIIYFGLVVLYAWQHYKLKGLLFGLLGSIVFISGLLWLSPHFASNVIRLEKHTVSFFNKDQKQTSAGYRLQFAQGSLRLIAKRPVFGSGVGSFRSRFKNEVGTVPGFGVVKDPHNEYLHTAVQLGLIGLLWLFIVFVVQWRASYRLEGEYAGYAQALVLTLMIGCACDSMIYLSVPGYFYVFFTALCFAPYHRKRVTKLVKSGQ